MKAKEEYPDLSQREKDRRRQINNGLYALAQAGVNIVTQRGRIPEHVSVALNEGVIIVAPTAQSQVALFSGMSAGTENARITLVGDGYHLSMGGHRYHVRIAPRRNELKPEDFTAMANKGIQAYWERTCCNYEVPTEV